jgi:hypothetical protein
VTLTFPHADASFATSQAYAGLVRTRGSSASGTRRRTITHLVDVERRHVGNHETFQAIAEASGVSASDLAHFNFETRDPRATLRCLRDVVGARRIGRNGEYVFRASDRPGVLLVPKPLVIRLAVGRAYTLSFDDVAHELASPVPPVYYRVIKPGVVVLDGPSAGARRVRTLAQDTIIRAMDASSTADGKQYLSFVTVTSSTSMLDYYHRDVPDGPDKWVCATHDGEWVIHEADLGGIVLKSSMQ